MNFCKTVFLVASVSLLASPALGHVVLTPDMAKAGSYYKLSFRIPHGCEGSSTTRLEVTVPRGVHPVKPQVHWNWQVRTTKQPAENIKDSHGKLVSEIVTKVVYEAKTPIPDDQSDEVSLQVGIAPDAESRLYFPVVQICEKGRAEWTDTSGKSGQNQGVLAAPSVRVCHPNARNTCLGH